MALDRKGLGQNELAEMVGASSGAASGWFSKGTYPGGNFIVQLPELLDVDGHWLLTGEGTMERKKGDDREALLDEWGAARARAVEKLADLLLADQVVLDKRAEAALEVGRAARIEAEKAPNRSAGDVEGAAAVSALKNSKAGATGGEIGGKGSVA